MNQINLVGIDVSMKELVVKLERDGEIVKGHLTFENTQAGHKKLIKMITKGKRKAKVCLEATGIYHFDLAVRFSKTKGIKVMVVNPRAIKHFAIASMKRAKTDPLDAGTILQFMKAMDFQAWEAPDENSLKIQSIGRRIFQLKAEIVREKNRQHAEEHKDCVDKLINNDIDVNIRHVQKRIKMLEEHAVETIHSDPVLKKQFDLLISIKGIAQKSAIQILAELISLPKNMQAAQWVAFAGLDPRPIESGSSINQPRRISKAGNKYLRTALYMPALVAIQRDKHVKAFYNKLIAAGKKPLQAIVAVMRKLLLAIWGMFKSGTTWNGKKFYHILSEKPNLKGDCAK